MSGQNVTWSVEFFEGVYNYGECCANESISHGPNEINITT